MVCQPRSACTGVVGGSRGNLLLFIVALDETEGHTGQAWERNPDMGTIPTQHHLLDLICPHCQKMNLIAVVLAQGASSYCERVVECAHCKKVWKPSLPGPVIAGPFPK